MEGLIVNKGVWGDLTTTDGINSFFADYEEHSAKVTGELREKISNYFSKKGPLVAPTSAKAKKISQVIYEMRSEICEETRQQITELMSLVIEESIPLITGPKKKVAATAKLPLIDGQVFYLTSRYGVLKKDAIVVYAQEESLLIDAVGQCESVEDDVDFYFLEENASYIPATEEQVETFFRQCKTVANCVGVADTLIAAGTELMS